MSRPDCHAGNATPAHPKGGRAPARAGTDGTLRSVITWFDALLVTLWAALTALGVRRGLSGLIWGLGGLAACLLLNSVSGHPWLNLILAGVLGLGLALAAQRFVASPLETPLHLAAGAVGGFLLGGAVVAAITLGFPMDYRVTPQGRTASYPSASLPPALYDAVRDSALNAQFQALWSADPFLKTLLVPDQAKTPRRN